MRLLDEMTPERLREYAAEDCEVSAQRDFILVAASAWAADRKRLAQGVAIVLKLRAQIEALEAEAAGRALMDAEGEAFLPEVVRQLQEHIEALERAGAEVKAAFGLWIPRTEHSIISKYQTDTLAALFSVLRSEEER